MPMKQRILRVELDMGSGQLVTWDQSLWLRVRINKAALSIQSRAVIEVGGLSKQARESILTKFTAIARRLRANGDSAVADNFVYVSVIAGYLDKGIERTAKIFKGEVAYSDLNSAPPNMSLSITAFTNQIDRSNVNMVIPSNATFREYASFVAQQANLRLEFDSVHGDDDAMNMGIMGATVQAMIVDLQNYYRADIVAFVDDDVLYVLDRGKVAKTSQVFTVDKFVGAPSWNEWGIEFRTMFDERIKLVHGIAPVSKINPAINQGVFVPLRLEYDLASRGTAFSIKVSAYPSAG